MELFKLSLDNLNVLLPHIKENIISGSGNSQMRTVEHILGCLKDASEPDKNMIVDKLVQFDVISIVCGAMQTANENFVKIVLECLELISNYRGFYENHTAVEATESILRLSYCVHKSLKDSTLFEKLVQSVCNILVRSSELAVDLDNVCIPQQIVVFLKDLEIPNLLNDKLKLDAVTMLNVVLQHAAVDEDANEEMIVDVCFDALKSITKIVKYGDDDNAILPAATVLCGTCAGGCRFCNVDLKRESQIDDDRLKICQKKDELSTCIYNTMMSVIIPYVKDADSICTRFRADLVKLHRNLISCLNNLYQLKNCNHDDLSNHLTANGYLKYFLCLIGQLPDNLRKSTCILLSRILSILGKTAFFEDTIKFANRLRHGFLKLPKEHCTERWSVVMSDEEDVTALMILLYYHYHGTGESNIIPLQFLITRIMLLSRSKSVLISVSVLKPLWFLFAVTSISHPCPYTINNYENAVDRLTSILRYVDISHFYTHHIDLLHYCLKWSDIPQNLMKKILDLWLIEADGDIKPLLPFNRDKVIHYLLIVIQTGYPHRIISLAVKGLRQFIQIVDDTHIGEIADIVWHILPNILSSYQPDTVVHIEAVLELANIIQPHVIPIHLIIRSANGIANIILKKNTDSKFTTLVVTQAYVLLVAATSRKSTKVLQSYIQKRKLLEKLYIYGFSKERSQLSAISIKLLAFIIHCQNKSSIKREQPLLVHIKSLVELLTYTEKSLCCAMNGMQFICELLTQNVDGSAVILRKIATGTSDVDMVINLYEILHITHARIHIMYREEVYQCLAAVLRYCNIEISTLIPHLCTVMSNYSLVFNVVKTRYVSCDFVEFVTTWLNYRKVTCYDVPWNCRSLYKSPFDEALDCLKEYSMSVNNKGFKDAHLNLQRALSQFESEQ